MPTNTTPACRFCRSVIAVTPVDGFCHRFPPTLMPNGSASWPVVHLDKGHCDEFKRGKNARQGPLIEQPTGEQQ